MRWRLAAVIAVLVAVAVALGALQIGDVASRYAAAGRDQHLARLGAAVVTLTQDLEDERDLSAAYTARPGTGPVPLTVVRARRATDAAAATVRAQAHGQANADLADFSAAADTTEQKFYSSTVSGRLVDVAAASEILAEQEAADHPPAPLTGTDAATWYREMSTTVGDTRKVTGQLAGQISGRANTLKSDAAKNLLLISIATGILLFLLLISAVLARPRQEA